MKFQNCILINFVTDARTDAHTHGQAESNMPLQLFQSWEHKNYEFKAISLQPITGKSVACTCLKKTVFQYCRYI